MQTLRDLRRSDDGRVLSGVAAGMAGSFRIPVALVRIAFVVLALFGGSGILIYIGCHLLLPDERGARSESSTVRAVLLAVIAFALAGVVRGLGFLPLSEVTLPVALAVIGTAFLWYEVRGDDTGPRPPMAEVVRRIVGDGGRSEGRSRIAVARTIVGLSLVIVSLVLFVASSGSIAALSSVTAAVGLLVLGLALLVGPSLWRLGVEAIDERTARVRADERADMAAHLHDSVLQTLTLIQLHPDRADEVARLARRQERELRAWLRNRDRSTGRTLGDGLRRAADGIEDDYGVTVDLVTVGDAAGDDRLSGLVEAAGEALRNAARHARVGSVSVYAEVVGDEVEVFVRDRGVGFDADGVPVDRRGIEESIIGRMARLGGEAAVRSTPGEGTEVRLRLDGLGSMAAPTEEPA